MTLLALSSGTLIPAIPPAVVPPHLGEPEDFVKIEAMRKQNLPVSHDVMRQRFFKALHEKIDNTLLDQVKRFFNPETTPTKSNYCEFTVILEQFEQAHHETLKQLPRQIAAKLQQEFSEISKQIRGLKDFDVSKEPFLRKLLADYMALITLIQDEFLKLSESVPTEQQKTIDRLTDKLKAVEVENKTLNAQYSALSAAHAQQGQKLIETTEKLWKKEIDLTQAKEELDKTSRLLGNARTDLDTAFRLNSELIEQGKHLKLRLEDTTRELDRYKFLLDEQIRKRIAEEQQNQEQDLLITAYERRLNALEQKQGSKHGAST